MNKQGLISIISVFIIILLATFTYNNKQAKEFEDIVDENIVNNQNEQPKETIEARYQYKNSKHVFVGSLMLPTPCHAYNTEVVRREKEVEIVVNTSPGDEICAQVITERLFKVSFEGDDTDFIVAKLNGELVNLNIFEIPDDENIDDIVINDNG